MSQSQVWLVTGASSGLGFEICKTALAAGHTVIAGCRDASKNPSLTAELERLGATWLQLDVTADDVESKVQKTVAKYGKIDVLVNNAGYGMIGSVEDTSIDQVKALFATNFMGCIRTIHAALPSMRTQSSGTIINITSSVGIAALPGLGIYSSSKFALEGLSESLYTELAAFNIRVLLVEPGALATRFYDPKGAGVLVPFSEAYQGTPADQFMQTMMGMDASAMGDATKAAQRIVEAVDGTGMLKGRELGLRLPLGSTGQDLSKKAQEYVDLEKNLRDVWQSI